MRPRIALSAGDPAGVGPELAVRALGDAEVRGSADVVVHGDARQLAELAHQLAIDLPDGRLRDVGAAAVEPGRITAASGRHAVAALESALADTRAGAADTLVTGPISKAGLNAAGYPWAGQTEALADLCATPDLRVMLVGGGLRVVHVTAHVPLAEAIGQVTAARVLRTIELAAEVAGRMGVSAPRVVVAGLNPHAGEGGLLGAEDAESIAPAVAAARELGIDASGPQSADTVFAGARANADVIVVMYHDQGHVPVKLIAPRDTVALTLGLPFLRVAADHGAAPGIAAARQADPASLIAALRLAAHVPSEASRA